MSIPPASHQPLPLPAVAPGQRVQVATVLAGQRATRRLKDLGIVPGTELRVIQSRGGGAMILAVGDSRLAVGRGVAHKVLVHPLAPRTTSTSSGHAIPGDQEVVSCPTPTA